MDLGRVYFAQGKYQQAVAEFQEAMKLGGQSTAWGATSIAELAKALAKVGRRNEALQILHRLESERTRRHVPALTIADIHVALGDEEQAFRWLKQAYQDRDADMILLKVLPTYDPLRVDSRFGDLLRRVGFPE